MTSEQDSAAGAVVTDVRRVELTAYPQTLVDVRRSTITTVQEWGLGYVADSVALCVHELLANVAEHTPSRACTFTLRRLAGGVSVVVADGSRTLPELREPGWDEGGGRGLLLVAALADDWGVESVAEGKRVWASFRGPAPEPGTAAAGVPLGRRAGAT